MTIKQRIFNLLQNKNVINQQKNIFKKIRGREDEPQNKEGKPQHVELLKTSAPTHLMTSPDQRREKGGNGGERNAGLEESWEENYGYVHFWHVNPDFFVFFFTV